jgi:hypothetical protein
MTTLDRPPVERVHPPGVAMKVANPVLRWVLSSPRRASRLGQQLLVLHVTARRTGRALDVPVAYRHTEDGRLLVLTNSGWRVNLRERPDVEVTLLGRRLPARAEIVEDADTVAEVYDALIATKGHANAARRLGIRVNVDRNPTREELADLVRRAGLSAVYLDVSEPVR